MADWLMRVIKVRGEALRSRTGRSRTRSSAPTCGRSHEEILAATESPSSRDRNRLRESDSSEPIQAALQLAEAGSPQGRRHGRAAAGS